MKTAIQFGAGNIGRGFMGQLFWEAGFKTIFVEANEQLVELLNTRQVYTLRLLNAYSKREEELSIDRFEALHIRQEVQIAEAIAESELICTAVGVKNLALIAPLIAAGIRKRFDRDGPAVDVWLCENQLGAADILKKQVVENLVGRCLTWSKAKVGFVGTAVARMVPSMEGREKDRDPLLVISDAHHELPYDAPAVRAVVPEVAGLQPAENFAVEMERKLFTHNLGHASLAYLGKLKGYKYVHESLQDSLLSKVFDGALDETTRALLSKYPEHIKAEEHTRIRQDVRIRFGNPMIMDTVKRVAKDPIRKLGPNERLIGSGKLCLSQGVFPDRIATICGAALSYNDSDDHEAVQLQRMIGGQGIDRTITEVTGLDMGSELFRTIAERYSELAESKVFE
jgi:mannitol-1-phosphate 5-dehydrogenase